MVVDEAEDDCSDPAEDDAKDNAVDPNANRCHWCDREQADPSVRRLPVGKNERDCQADHEQGDQRCRESPSQCNDVKGTIRRSPLVRGLNWYVNIDVQ